MELWDKIKEVPKEFTKSITGGRLKGMTDIKPQWRYMVMTEQFGAVGFGWYYDITNQWIEEGANGEKAAFTNIALYVKMNDEWSKPIYGNGGSSFISNEKHGAYTSDECFKMSLTDALSVAMSKLGLGANVYMGQGTKYTQPIPNTPEQVNTKERPYLNPNTKEWKGGISKGTPVETMLQYFRISQANKEEYTKQLNAKKS